MSRHVSGASGMSRHATGASGMSRHAAEASGMSRHILGASGMSGHAAGASGMSGPPSGASGWGSRYMQGNSTEMNPGYVRIKEPRFLKISGCRTANPKPIVFYLI